MTEPARLPRGDRPATPAEVGRAVLSWIQWWWGEHEDPADPSAPQPLPPTQFLAGGEPRLVAWDHDDGQVTVAVERVIMGLDPTVAALTARSPRADPANAGKITRHVRYEVQIVRPAPALSYSGAIPGGSAIDAHGYELMGDMGWLLTCLADGLRGGKFLREIVGEGNAVLGDGMSLGPQGGLSAIACNLTVPLL